MNFTYILNDIFNPLFNFPPGGEKSPSPMGEGWDGGLISIREDLFNIKRH